MKKLLPIILSIVLLLAACGGRETPPQTTQAPETTAAPTTQGPEGVGDALGETVTVLVKFAALNEDGHLQWYREYEYDEQGICTAEREVASDGTVTYEKKNTADDKGRLSLSEIFRDGSMTGHGQYAYDDQDRLIREEVYENGALLQRAEYTYDDRDNALTVKLTMGDGFTQTLAYSYRYDEQGNVLEREETVDGSLATRTEMTYDEAGHCIREVTYGADGSVQSTTESVWEGSTETQFYYDSGDVPYLTRVTTYDEAGNITFRENQHAGGVTTQNEYTYATLEIKK